MLLYSTWFSSLDLKATPINWSGTSEQSSDNYSSSSNIPSSDVWNRYFRVDNLFGCVPRIPNCFRGSFYDGKKCTPCPPGTFREILRSQKDRCTPCPAGSFTPNYGSGSKELCWKCPENFFSEKGATSCTPCPAGLTSSRGSRSCVACELGSYSTINFWGVPRCAKCEPGTYRDNTKDALCTSCPDGLTSKRGSTSRAKCYKCPAGKFMSTEDSSGCKPCYDGRFKSTIGDEFCSFCPPGFIAPNFGATKCDPCPIGTKSASGARKCNACPEGFATFTEGQSICRKLGKRCPPTTVEGPSGDCHRCGRGYYLSDLFMCTLCPPDSRSLGGTARSCIKCPDRQTPMELQGGCLCPPGEYVNPAGTCSICPPGTEMSGRSNDNDRCYECGSSSIAPEPGTAMCQICPSGYVANKERTKCVKCEAGYTVNDPLSSRRDEYCVNITTGCPAGFRRNDVGPPCNVYYCRVGTSPEEVGRTCLPCEKGFALLKEGGGCKLCPAGYVSDGGIITECRKCPNGLQTDTSDRSKCTCLAPGYAMQNGTCAKCPLGTAADYLETTCSECPRGTYTKSEGQARCFGCPQNTFKANAGPGICEPCPKGLIGHRKEGSYKCVME